MIRSLFIQAVFAFGLVSGASFVSGCSSDSAHAEGASATGTFSMPLLATAGTHTYRLQGGLYVSGPAYQFFSLDSDASVLSANLPTGNYYANLYAWTLTRDNGSGQFVPVSASLISSGVNAFSIFNQTTTTVSFQFQTDGQIVAVGSGQLNVAIGVHESPLVCTPLGDDCSAGSWCAPTELTGAPLQCIPAGSVALGEACSGPNDCAANSSCFDLGTGVGAACLQLCSESQFNEPCGTGGQCTPKGSTYGVCVLNAASGAAADFGT